MYTKYYKLYAKFYKLLCKFIFLVNDLFTLYTQKRKPLMGYLYVLYANMKPNTVFAVLLVLFVDKYNELNAHEQ